MFKYAALVVVAFSIVTVSLVIYAVRQDHPKFDVAAAGRVFDRYPFWQSSAVSSTEVVLDPQFSTLPLINTSAPSLVSQDAIARWQKQAKPAITLEFGLERLNPSLIPTD
ncbi:MAG: hypothetical protein AAF221_05160 [Pseudomonadota bacterium]